MSYAPSKQILGKYANLLVNYALHSGKGIKKNEVVYLQVSEAAKPMYVALRDAILKSGGTYISNYMPDDVVRGYFELASEEQLSTFHDKYYKGLIEQIDHSILIISETDKHELEGIDPKKIILHNKTFKPYLDWRSEKENKGKFTWTLGLYGTEAMAKEAKMTLADYWNQIIKACYLDEKDPISKWREIFKEMERIKNKLNSLKIEEIYVKGEGIDLKIKIGPGRKWLGGRGRNIPSFEIFISPDWRGTEGTINFNQPLYRYGMLVEGINLTFKNGVVTKASALKNEKLLKEIIRADSGSNKIGEFSLTDGRFSRVSKFMANTLYDENMGGQHGNVHIALGKAYKDSYPGNFSHLSKKTWQKLGYNDSVIHTDMISTTKRRVVVSLTDGTQKVIYKDGEFIV
jgi:aminopeptidase